LFLASLILQYHPGRSSIYTGVNIEPAKTADLEVHEQLLVGRCVTSL